MPASLCLASRDTRTAGKILGEWMSCGDYQRRLRAGFTAVLVRVVDVCIPGNGGWNGFPMDLLQRGL